MTTEAAALRSIAGTFTTNGTVVEDESLRFDVNVKVAGWVRKLRVERTGDRVRRGDPLLTVYSPDLVATERELVLALENERRLAGSGNAEAARDAARLTAASKDRLRLWDVPDAEIERIASDGRSAGEIPIVVSCDRHRAREERGRRDGDFPGMNLYCHRRPLPKSGSWPTSTPPSSPWFAAGMPPTFPSVLAGAAPEGRVDLSIRPSTPRRGPPACGSS